MAGEQDRIEGEEPREWAAGEGEPLETEQLLLEDEERLPWLESSDEDYGEYEGSDTGRMLGFVLMGLVALAAIVGGIWWATNRTTDPQLADGSVIAAPGEPYKSAPANPGGKTFEGTGDSSFAVSEGQTRPAQLGPGNNAAGAAGTAAAPKGAGAAAGTTGAAATANAAAGAALAGGVGVQVGAYSTSAKAEAGWASLAARNAAVLSGVRHRVVQGTAESGTIFRLQAVAGDAGAANALCGKLKAAGTPCQVK